MNKLQEYVERYKRLHLGTDPYLISSDRPVYNKPVGDGKTIFDGSQLGRKLPPFIQQLIDKKGRAITLLDYGCGRALHLTHPLKEHGNKTLLGRLNGMIQCYYCYDPAVDIYSEKPPAGMVFDLVCCADVMEHVPKDFVPTVLQEIADYTKVDGSAMFTISGNPAKKTFVDGENLHATVESFDWWVDSVKSAFGDKSFIIIYNNESVVPNNLRFVYHNSQVEPVWAFSNTVNVNGQECQVERA